ncbi:MAG: type II toxin-antitoxin system VapC family toxin [Magnetococcales bacterium]|nr:type II toxin-antitoxin system VapC family toxin [Magnetococcales bacterium]
MIVLDSHIWFWWINLEHDRLSPRLLEKIDNAEQIGVSAVSCFELALAHSRGRLSLPLSPSAWFACALEGSHVEMLPLTRNIAVRAVALTSIHRDPFNRIIIATALEYDGMLVSMDSQFGDYPELKGRLVHS